MSDQLSEVSNAAAEPGPEARRESREEPRGDAGVGGGRGVRPPGRSKKGSGRSKSLYTFPDDLERNFCRNATRVPPQTFPVAAREGVARPAMVELARTDKAVLFCDLLHEGPHLWPDGEEFIGV